MKHRARKLRKNMTDVERLLWRCLRDRQHTRAGNHVAGQLLRSGTSPYPNHGEAQAAESPKDFIHKKKNIEHRTSNIER